MNKIGIAFDDHDVAEPEALSGTALCGDHVLRLPLGSGGRLLQSIDDGLTTLGKICDSCGCPQVGSRLELDDKPCRLADFELLEELAIYHCAGDAAR